MSSSPHPDPTHGLPYADRKAVGAADFYFAINATFRFICRSRGEQGLVKYWTDLGTRYYAPVANIWKRDGLQGVADYWQAFFTAEPGSSVHVTVEETQVVVDVEVCPAIAHLRADQREILPTFCHHCYHVSEAIARQCGMTVRVEGGNGTCRQRFMYAKNGVEPQDFGLIRTAI